MRFEGLALSTNTKRQNTKYNVCSYCPYRKSSFFNCHLPLSPTFPKRKRVFFRRRSGPELNFRIIEHVVKNSKRHPLMSHSRHLRRKRTQFVVECAPVQSVIQMRFLTLRPRTDYLPRRNQFQNINQNN